MKIKSFFTITLTIFFIFLLRVEIAKGSGVFAYIPNYGSNDVSVIDTSTNGVVSSTISVGNNPNGIAVTQDGKKVYVTNQQSKDVSVIDTSTNKVTNLSIKVGSGPKGIVVTPDGKKVYVANLGSNDVSVIDASTDMVTNLIMVGSNPLGIAVTPDGKKVYVANLTSDNISVIDTSTNMVVKTIGVGSRPYGIVVAPNGKKAYVTNLISHNISVIDTLTDKTIGAPIPAEYQPEGIAITPDGKKVYVVKSSTYDVSVIDTSSDTIVVDSIKVGVSPEGISITPDGKKAYVVNRNSNDVSVIDTSTDKVIVNSIGMKKMPSAFGNFITPFITSTPLGITSSLTENVKVGKFFNYTFTTVGDPPATKLTVTLPAFNNGLTYDENTKVISGTPVTSGIISIGLHVENGKVVLDERLTVTVAPLDPPLINSSLTVSGEVGKSFTYQFSAEGEHLEGQPITLTASSLPNGLTFDPNTGIISGIPMIAGAFDVKLHASNGMTATDKVLALNISPSSGAGGGCSLGSQWSPVKTEGEKLFLFFGFMTLLTIHFSTRFLKNEWR